MTFHACDSSLDSLVKRLEHDANLATEWFDCNYMNLNQDDCHLMISAWVKIGETKIWESRE